MSRAPAERAERLATAVAGEGLDALIVGDLVNPADSSRDANADVAWLTGFTGTSGLALVGPGVRLFVTDFRYAERAGAVADSGFDLIVSQAEIVAALESHLSGNVGFDPAATSVHWHAKLGELCEGRAELVEAPGLTGRCRRRKGPEEIEAIAAAADLTDAVFAELEAGELAGRSEHEVAVWAETRMRELGASAPSFPAIVAAGPNGALPHAEPSRREIGRGELVVVDMGCILDGYCSDCTRTYAAGADPGPEATDAYELVLAAQLAALDAIGPGVAGREADAVARELIGAGGHAEHFGHGLGHGVGVQVHEAPRLSQRSQDTLEAGDVVTVEPGVYVPGRFGVRIEDLVALAEDGVRNLSSRPKELRVCG